MRVAGAPELVMRLEQSSRSSEQGLQLSMACFLLNAKGSPTVVQKHSLSTEGSLPFDVLVAGHSSAASSFLEPNSYVVGLHVAEGRRQL